MLPSLYREDPEFYENMRIQDLAQNIHKLIEHHNLPDLMFRAFEVLPSMVMTPYAAFQKELHGQTEEVYLEEMVGRVNANMILPYPPGVPLVMPGEMITERAVRCWSSCRCCAKSAPTIQASKPISTAPIVRRMVVTPLKC